MIYTYQLVYKKLVFVSILFVKKTFRLSSVSAVKVWYFCKVPTKGRGFHRCFSKIIFANFTGK